MWRLSSKTVRPGKSGLAFIRAVMRSLTSDWQTTWWAFVFRKKFVVRHFLCRTANRHWWVGRVDQGDREKAVQGTRQISWT